MPLNLISENHDPGVIVSITYSTSSHFCPSHPYQYNLVDFENPRVRSDVWETPRRDGHHIPVVHD